jgi:hypothetical protein
MGTRTTASASARVSSGSPHASLPKIQAVGPPIVPSSSSASRSRSPAPSAASSRAQAVHDGLHGDADGDREVEQAAGGGPYGLGVVQVHRGVGEDHRVRPGGVRAAQHGAGVAGVADIGQYGHQPGAGGEDVLERRVQEAAQPDDALRGDGVGHLRDDLGCRRQDGYAGGVGRRHDVRVPLGRVRRHVHLDQVRDRFADGLRALGDEAALLAAEAALGQAVGGGHAGRAEGGQLRAGHGTGLISRVGRGSSAA